MFHTSLKYLNSLERRKGLFWFMVSESSCCHFGPVAAEYLVVGESGRGNLYTSWWPGSKRREREVGRDQDPNNLFKSIH